MKKKLSRILGVSLTLVLLVSLTLSAAVMATISQPKVTVTPNAISTPGEYEIKFDAYFALTGGTDTITVEFPSGTTVPNGAFAAGAVQVDKDGGASYTNASATGTSSTRQVVVTVPVGEGTGAAAHMQVKFLTTTTTDIINPATPGTYTLKVKTSQETTNVESESYTIGIPGVVTRYNKDGNYVGSYMTLQAAIDATTDKDSLKLGPGTYKETDITTVSAPAVVTELTIEGTSVDDVIVEATKSLGVAGLVIDIKATVKNMTIKGTTSVTGASVTFENVALAKKSKTSTETLLTSTGDRLKVKNCTIDTTLGDVADTGILIDDGDYVSIESNTITTDDGDGATKDTAIDVNAAAAVASLTVKENDFTGTKGTAYTEDNNSVTTSTVKDNTFDGYEMACDVNNAVATSKLTIQNNTISNSAGKTVGAIDVDATTAVIIVGNTIQDGDGYSVHVSANAANVTCIGNNLVNNDKGLANSTTDSLTAENNWWGDASGPAGEGTGTGDKVSTSVDYKPYLAASIVKGQAATGATSLDAEKTAGVKVSDLGGAATVIWTAKYASNPKSVDPKYSALADAWYDVYISGGGAPATIKLYADGIDKNTDAYCWSELENKWIGASTQGASASGGYVWVTVTATSTPAYGDLTDLPFVLVAAPEAKPSTFALTAPEAGAETALTNVPFTWASVAEAESYELVISANADMSSPMVKVTAVGTAYTYTGTLTDGTPYYWQVTALKDEEVKGKSDVGTFVAMAPVEPEPPVVIEPYEPPVIEPVIEIPPSPLTPGIVWAIIAIGAILVIAVIVLIVRTRRVT